jgi:hypothetical protein
MARSSRPDAAENFEEGMAKERKVKLIRDPWIIALPGVHSRNNA